MGRKILKELFELGVYLLVVLCITYLIITFVGQRTIVKGRSMEPTLYNNDNLIVNKLTYRFHDPERFDIVVFPYRYEEDTYYIKRIIGLPGETVRIDEEGVIYINGEPLEENYGREVIEADKRGRAAQEVMLGSDEYFVMGDNRNHSADSRTTEVGNVKREELIGKAWVRIWPIKDMEVISHQ